MNWASRLTDCRVVELARRSWVGTSGAGDTPSATPRLRSDTAARNWVDRLPRTRQAESEIVSKRRAP